MAYFSPHLKEKLKLVEDRIGQLVAKKSVWQLRTTREKREENEQDKVNTY